MNARNVVSLALLAAVACASEQKVKSWRQASAEAQAAREAKGKAAQPAPEAKPAPAAAPAQPPERKRAEPFPPPRSRIAEKAEPAPAEKKSDEKQPPAPEAAPAPREVAQPAAAPAPVPAPEPAPAEPAEEAKPEPEPAPAAKAEPAPLPELPAPPAAAPAAAPPAPAAAAAPDEEAPAGPPEPAPSGPRGGLCVQRASPPPAGGGWQAFEGSGPAVVALSPLEKSGTVALQVQFRSGAIDDPPGKAGLTALTATLMAEGGTQSLDARALREALFPTAATIRARVDKELTTFATRLHRDHLEQVVGLFTEALLRPRWDEKEFARLRDKAIDDVEKRLRQGDDEELGKAALESLLYRGHPYGRLTEGHVSELRSITLAEVRAHAARVFTSGRARVGVAGGYPDGLPQDLAKALQQLPRDGAAPVSVAAQPARGLRYLLVHKPTAASTAISLGLPYGLSRAHPDFAAMAIARSIFGEHRKQHGRLATRLRGERGLNYGDYAYVEHFEQEGGDASQAQTGRARHQQEFSIWLRPVQNENALFALRAALYELRRSLQEEPFTDQEVELAKSFLAGYTTLYDQTEARKLGYALDGQALGLHREPGFMADLRRKLPEVTAAQVNEAWRRWIDPCQLQIALVTPDAAALKRALLSGAPTPMGTRRPKRPAAVQRKDAAIERFSFGAPAEAEIEVVEVEKLFE